MFACHRTAKRPALLELAALIVGLALVLLSVVGVGLSLGRADHAVRGARSLSQRATLEATLATRPALIAAPGDDTTIDGEIAVHGRAPSRS